jgi:cytochrome c biogenesis protein CcmG, thiol:disulfide interchange protein DsbE
VLWQSVNVRKRAPWAACIALAIPLAGCGSHARSVAPSQGQRSVAFKGSPPVLVKLHSQANQLLGGGPSAFQARLRSLRGHPVVVNMWASWCGPCQSEFPTYQQASLAFGRQVAFLGLDAKDQNAAASSFLRKFPVTYPSYVDPSGGIASAINAYQAYPQTFFFNRDGTKVYDKAGPYLSVRELERDIRHYVLG